jgi:[ribosomal protein S5]-alanine N-acetyltransferase
MKAIKNCKIEVRNQKLSDAKRFYEILDNDKFIYFGVRPKSIEEEKEFLKKNKDKIKNNFEHNYTILFENKVIGAIGIKINQHRKYIGEIGYFVDENFWGKGIATKAVKIIEKIGFNQLGLKRIEILMNPRNKASEKVAIKTGYNKEGKMIKTVYSFRNKKYEDVLLYAKVK